MTNPMTREELEALLPVIDAAVEEVSRLCNGKRWVMHVPVEDTDPDIVLSRGLANTRRLVETALAAMDERDAEEHVRAPGGFTHWSSGPGNLTFDPSCPRCWRERAEAAEARLAEALEALEKIAGNPADDLPFGEHWSVELARRALAAIMTKDQERAS